MAKTDTVEYKSSACPCKKGEIVALCETSENHGWGEADWSFELRCETCADQWTVSGRFLKSRSGKSISLKRPVIRPFS